MPPADATIDIKCLHGSIEIQAMSPYPYFEALPNELILKIADFAAKACFSRFEESDWTRELNAVKSLRLVSKRLCGPATTSLAKNYLSKLVALMTKESLKTLADICAHPAFGPHVRTIHFVASRINPQDIAEVSDNLVDARERGDKSLEEIEALKNQLYSCMDRCTQEEKLARSGMSIALLTNAFQYLRGYGSSITLSLADELWPQRELKSDGHYYQLLAPASYQSGFWEFCAEESHFKSTSGPCFAALAQSKLRVKELFLFERSLAFSSPNERGLCVSSIVKEDPMLFSDLEYIWFWTQEPGSEPTAMSMEQIILQANHLRTFVWSPSPTNPARGKTKTVPKEFFECQDQILRSVSSSSIEKFEIEDTCLSLGVLIDIFQKNKKTMKSIFFNRCLIRDGHWSQLLDWIRENLVALDDIHLCGLFDTAPRHGEAQYDVRPFYDGPPEQLRYWILGGGGWDGMLKSLTDTD